MHFLEDTSTKTLSQKMCLREPGFSEALTIGKATKMKNGSVVKFLTLSSHSCVLTVDVGKD